METLEVVEGDSCCSSLKWCYNDPLALAICGSVEIILNTFDFLLFCCTKSKDEWPFPLFGCLTYRTPDKQECILVPDLFPWAFSVPCCVLGQSFSYDLDEDPLCFEMGPRAFLSSLPALSGAFVVLTGTRLTGHLGECLLWRPCVNNPSLTAQGERWRRALVVDGMGGVESWG
ncbi:hypothetical protein CYMTET_26358 [Cymbomonas tetramitiformis]|uniref:Uncharacterized protein n=1 Tax=Cymbomonas tetramitiformis TaxID=36881 RepID=A0AAE0FSP7_9CHLO|nr:hypothetical protein CYMTET_26358 [Cymbomonas tetramitiformis]